MIVLAKKGVIAIDFDGVIGDSVKECFVQSVKAYNGLGGRIQMNGAMESRFREARPFITKALHFFTVLRLIEKNVNFKTMQQAKFNSEYAKDIEKAQLFEKKFYEKRREMQEISPKEWVALQKSFPRIVKFVRKLQAGNKVFIATTKDRKSVVELLKRYGLNIPEQNIVAKEFALEKTRQLEEVAKRAKVKINQVVLIDDAIEQVRAARAVGAKGILAKWGYSTAAQRKQAKREKIPLLLGNKGPKPREGKKIARMARRAA